VARGSRWDAIVVGGGHNSLVAAAMLARAGRSVLVLERRGRLGGAAVSEAVFQGHEARLSRFAYLVSLFPRWLLRDLGVGIELRARPEPRLGPGWDRLRGIAERVGARVLPTLTAPLPSRERLREQLADDEAWEALFERPLSELLERTIDEDAVRGIALTDGLIGTFVAAEDPELRQNRCFLYHVIGGSWRVPVGGMGALGQALGAAARSAGARVLAGAEVTRIATDGRRAEVATAGGATYECRHVLAGVAPAVLHRLLGEPPPQDLPEGSQLKINLLLGRLPRLRDASLEPARAFAGTFHVNEGYEQLARAHAEAAAGRVPTTPPCELYCHSLSDPSILGPRLRAAGAHTMTLFALHMPARLFAQDHDRAKARAVAATIASVDSVLAEPLEDCLLRDADGRPCLEAHTPQEIEAELAMPGGHIFHRDLSWPFAESEAEVGRWGVETDHANVWLCGAGARRGGAVSGIPGHNAARAVLEAESRARAVGSGRRGRSRPYRLA